VTLTGAGTSGGVFVSTERDNNVGGVSRPEILRFDPSTEGTSLNATMEWNLTSDLPAVGANLGLEALSWIPDAYLTSQGFIDEHTGMLYDPAAYPDHGDGLFFAGLEGNGTIYAYALNQVTGDYTRIATIASGFPTIMGLEYEPETHHLWAACDNSCNGEMTTLDIDTIPGATQGRFVVTHTYERPASMPNTNNEGLAIAPQSTCMNGHKPVFWSDDNNAEGHALRGGTLDCAAVDADHDGINDDVDATFPPGVPETADPTNDTFADVLIGGSTSGKILNRGGHGIAVANAGNPSGVLVDIDSGPSGPAQFQLTGSAAVIAGGPGRYELTGSAKTTTVSALSGEPAVITVRVNGTPITLTVGTGGSVTYTEVTDASGRVTGLTDIKQTGGVGIRGDGLPEGACGTLAIQNIIVATTGNDDITGTPAADLIIGRGGNDTVNGVGGDDCIVTGSGNDKITTTDGDDWIDAGGGNNVIHAGNGANVVTTASGNDAITTGDGDDTIDAGDGNNTVSTGAGNDVVTTGGGNDSVDCGGGSDEAQVAPGNDSDLNGSCEAFTG
jgi:Ca2+-binding RTX toxin-like protein